MNEDSTLAIHYPPSRIMTLQYDKESLHFMYPEGWEISEDETAQWPKEVVVSAPQGGFWSVVQYSTPVELTELVDEILAAMRADYESFEVHPLESEAAVTDVTEKESVDYEMYFYFKNRLLRAHCHCFKVAQYTHVVLYQCEDRHFDEVEPVFKAMKISLEQGVKS